MDTQAGQMPALGGKGRKNLLFVNKKKQKNFVFLVLRVESLQRPTPRTKGAKVFWFFFSKKNTFLPLRLPAPPLHAMYQSGNRGDVI
jgi:hypothetical protein